MSVWLLVAVLSLLLLFGVWVYERLPRWRAADERARREPLTDEQFGERFYTPDQAKIAARLRRIASEQLAKELTRLHPDDPLAKVVFDGFDSLDSVEVLMAIEEEFGIELDEAAAINIATFRDLVDAVAARRPFLAKWRREMGLAIEEQFGVSLPREVLARLTTPHEVVNAVAAELKDQVGFQESCQSQRAFYLLRSAMVQMLRVPRAFIRPTTPLRALIGWRAMPSRWAQLRDAVRARQWPPLVRPRWMNWLVYGFPLFSGAAATIGLPSLADWASLQDYTVGLILTFAAELRVLVAIAVATSSWILLVRVLKRCNRGFPRNIRTIGDLVPFVVTSAEMPWNREQIERKVREIVVSQLRVPKEDYRTEGRFLEEFGLAVGLERAHFQESAS